MTLILYVPGVNWFYEALSDVDEELRTAGVTTRLITPHEFVAAGPTASCGQTDVIIVNAVECVHTLVGPVHDDSRYVACLTRLCQCLSTYRHRILLNLDAIDTPWFRGQMQQVGTAVNEIFDLGMLRQTDRPELQGYSYTWIPESFTDRAMRELVPHDSPRPIPWAVVGHATLERAELADRLKDFLGPAGLVFLPGFAPSGATATATCRKSRSTAFCAARTTTSGSAIIGPLITKGLRPARRRRRRGTRED